MENPPEGEHGAAMASPALAGPEGSQGPAWWVTQRIHKKKLLRVPVYQASVPDLSVT